MKKILFILLVLTSLTTQIAFGTAYYSNGNQDPTNVNNWWDQTNGTGNHPPNFTTAGNTFNVQNGHNMSPTATWTVSGTGSKVIIKTGGTITAGGFNHSLTLDMESGGTWIHSHTTYSALTFGTLDAASNFQLNNASGFAGTRTYPNLILNGITINPGTTSLSINGNLDLKSGAIFRGTSTGTPTHSIGGNLLVASGATWTMSNGTGTPTYNISGTITNNGGSIGSSTGVSTINLNGSNSVTLNLGTPSNTNFNITIASTKTVTLGSNVATSNTFTNNGVLDCSTFNITGAGTFAMASTNATLKIGSSAGLESGASGNIQTTTKTFNFGGSGNTFEYNGGSAQSTGSLLTGTIRNLTVSNATGVTLSGSISIQTTANITGLLQMGTNTMTQTGGAATLSGTGTIKLDGVIGTYSSNTFQTNGTYQFNGTNQDVPSGSYKNITVNGGDAQLTGNVSLSGVLAVNGTLTLGANKLTFTGSSPTRTAEGIDASNTNAEIEFNSAGTITLPASLFTGDIGKLTMTGSGLVTSSDNINVTNALTLTNGFLNMGANTLTLGTSTSNEGTYSRTSGTIRGTFKRWIASGASTKEFPLDNGSGALSMATVTFTSLGTGGTLTAKFNNSGSGTLSDNGGLGYLATGPSMSNVNLINLAPQYWTITAGDGLATPNYSIDITGDGVPNISEINYIAIVKRADNTQPWAWNSGNHSTTTGSTSNPILHGVSFTSFSEFGVGGNVDNLLPVELSSFTSAVAGRNVTLSWSTGNEQNNSGFDIERKSTVTEWVKIGNVEGHGTVNTPNSYSFNDNALSSGRYSYRLKQIDYNGNFRYYYLSNEINIGAPSKYSLSQNYPNPFNPVTTISYEIPNADFVALKVYDMTGKEVASLVNEKQDAGFYSIRFDASRLSSGVYFYTLKSSDFVSTKKLILVK